MGHTGSDISVNDRMVVKDAGSKLVAALIVAMSGFGIIARVFPKAGNLVDLMMIGISVFTVLSVFKADFRIRRDQTMIVSMLAVLCLSLIVSFALNQSVNAVVQFLLYAAYLTPLLILHRVDGEDSYRVFLPLLMIIGIMQLPADLLFPNEQEHILDAYAGTFSIANNKSRFLFLALICAAFIYRSKRPFVNKIILPGAIAAMLISFKLGDSIFVYLFGALAVFLGIFHKRRYLAAASVAVFAFCLFYIFNVYEDEPVLMFTYHRFFDPDHGVMAAANYGLKLTKETYFLGAGLGEFVSRASQSLGGLYLDMVPRTMITFGTIYENTAAPTGLPAYISIIAEMGVLGVILSALLVYYLYRSADRSYLGFVFFIYIILLSLFLPMFYEGPDGMLFVYSYVILNKALEHKRRMACTG